MTPLPNEIIAVLNHFAPFFRAGVWPQVVVLVVGAILAPGKRTVTAALRVMGLSQERHFQRYHRILNRVRWSSLAVARVLLQLLVAAFGSTGPLVLGIDETLERRRGAQIGPKGIYRDPVRSSRQHFVKASGLRWVCLMLLVPIPWARRVWALPFLTVLAPSERYQRRHTRRHKPLTAWARQRILQVRRWLPHRALVVVADSSYAALDLLAACSRLAQPVALVTRLRLDAALYDPPPARHATTRGRPRLKGARQTTLAQRLHGTGLEWQPVRVAWYASHTRLIEVATDTALWYHAGKVPVVLRWVLVRDPAGQFATQALLCTDVTAAPAQIVSWFVQRWQLEVTQQEARAHLGVESQRQWSDLAIWRTTPALLALFSLVTLCAHHLLQGQPLPPRQAAWYTKPLSTFADTLAFVRYHLWPLPLFSISMAQPDIVQIPRAALNHLIEMLAFAA